MSLLDDLSSSFYLTLSDASVRRLCKAREYASDVRRHYQGQPCPDDNLLSTMSAIMEDFVDALMSSKPFRSHSLSDALTTGFNAASVSQAPWLLRFAHSFLLVMGELEHREFAIPEAKTESTAPPATATVTATVALSPITNSFAPLIVPMANSLSGLEGEIKIEEEHEQLPIQQYPFTDARYAEVKEESAELEDPFQHSQLPGISNIASTSHVNVDDNQELETDRIDDREWSEEAELGKTSMLDAELIAQYSIPFAAREIIEMKLKAFMALPLTEEQHTIAKQIRRRGLKRLSARRKVKRQKLSSHEPQDASTINYVYDNEGDSD